MHMVAEDKNIKSTRAELQKLYESVPISKNSELEFLRGLDSYFNFIQKEKILKRIITTMLEDSVRESIQIIQESAQDDNAKNWYESAEYMEKYGGRYPIHSYNQLLELWKNLKK